MKTYIQNIIPRVKEFSNSLDKKELFIEVPWVFIDENLDQQKYIFKRNGELLMSLNGKVNIGRWEYISSAKSLLIDRLKDKILLNQTFLDPSVMILNQDGYKNGSLFLANEILLPDLDVAGYLQRLFYTKNHITLAMLVNGDNLEVHNYYGSLNGSKVSINGEFLKDTVLELKAGKKLKIKDSIILGIITKEKYATSNGTIEIEYRSDLGPRKGDFVFLDNQSAPDGKYKIGFFKTITVKDGIII